MTRTTRRSAGGVWADCRTPGQLRFNHQIHLHLEGKGLHGIDGALSRLKQLECDYCHQPDVHGRRMAPVRYERACAECHPLNVRIVAEPADAAVSETIESFCRQPAPHVVPALVSAVLRERLRLVAQQQPRIGMSDPMSGPLRSLPGGRPEPHVPRDLADWVDYQTSKLGHVLFDSPGGCQYCHIPKRDSPGRFAPVAYEPTNVPVSWFPYAKFSHAKHGLMACSDCHEQARTSTRTRDVLMPAKQICIACHSSQGSSRGTPGPTAWNVTNTTVGARQLRCWQQRGRNSLQRANWDLTCCGFPVVISAHPMLYQTRAREERDVQPSDRG